MLFIVIFFSAVFWMSNTADYWAWSLLEILAVVLAIRTIRSRSDFFIPERKIVLPFLVLLLWTACALLWTQNFHATLTGFYKVIFICLLIFTFFNSIEQWKKRIQWAGTGMSLLLAAVILAFPSHFFLDRSPYPNLYSGFLALGSILCNGLFLTLTGSSRWVMFLGSIFIASAILVVGSTGAFLCWVSGTLVQGFNQKKKAWILFLPIILLSPFLFFPIKKGWHSAWQKKAEDPTRFERVQLWKDSLHYWTHYPWKGTGLGTFRDYYPEFKTIQELRTAPYAHNEAIHFICEMGLIGLFFSGWLVWALFKYRKRVEVDGTWFAILIAASVHSLVDFNLRYPPILVLFVFSICIFIPVRMVTSASRWIRAGSQIILCILMLFMILPGIADLLFRISYHNPVQRQRSAILAAQLDPLNGIYWFEKQTIQDLQTAIELEPRNVWFHRTAARFWVNQWKQTKDSSYLESAVKEYKIVIRLAPNVVQFQNELAQIIELTNPSVSVIKNPEFSRYGIRHH